MRIQRDDVLFCTILQSKFIKKSLILDLELISDLQLINKSGHRGGGRGCTGYAVAHPVYGRLKALKIGEIS